MPGFCLDDECWRKSEDKLHSLLKQGLNDRVKLIRVTWKNAPFEWNIEDVCYLNFSMMTYQNNRLSFTRTSAFLELIQQGLSKFSDEPMLVGMLNSTQEKSFRVVDVGPSPEDKEEVLSCFFVVPNSHN